jgi:hypothetical protein
MKISIWFSLTTLYTVWIIFVVRNGIQSSEIAFVFITFAINILLFWKVFPLIAEHVYNCHEKETFNRGIRYGLERACNKKEVRRGIIEVIESMVMKGAKMDVNEVVARISERLGI